MFGLELRNLEKPRRRDLKTENVAQIDDAAKTSFLTVFFNEKHIIRTIDSVNPKTCTNAPRYILLSFGCINYGWEG